MDASCRKCDPTQSPVVIADWSIAASVALIVIAAAVPAPAQHVDGL
jgi:hypothetical protein